MDEPDIGRQLALSPTSSLILPRSLRQNRSFTQLARFIGLTTDDKPSPDDSGSDEALDQDGTDNDLALSNRDDDDYDADEESLMWDAQTALIAHQPALAAKYYATAALPPHSSPAACLALGNLLARGSGLNQPDSEQPLLSSQNSSKGVCASPRSNRTAPSRSATSWFASLFSSNEAPTQTTEQHPAPPPQSNGWGLPTDGKRAVRNVESMGKAGGWLVLGIGWIMASESATGVTALPARERRGSDDDGAVHFDSKGKSRARANVARTNDHSSTTSVETAESMVIHTPEENQTSMSAAKKIKLLYELLTPLVQLYRHGHIQRHDPVALPPLSSSQLPQALRPQGDKEKGRNVWYLGSAVATKLLGLPLLSTSCPGKEATMRRIGVLIMANYIRGITSRPEAAEASFKAIIHIGPCGLEVPDDLIHQAYRRLGGVLQTTGGSPIAQTTLDSYPFPLTPRQQLRHRTSNGSLISYAGSTATASLPLQTPIKSSASLASLACDSPAAKVTAHEGHCAINSLRSIQSHQRQLQSAREARAGAAQGTARWPALHTWSMTGSSKQSTMSDGPRSSEHVVPRRSREYESITKREEKRPLRAVASSPQLDEAHLSSSRSRRQLPFEPTEAVAAIDPELAALELASALTKHVNCSVCGAAGVNFPNCRKCGLTFCSRHCRVDESGAGNGKRYVNGAGRVHPRSPQLTTSHICGAWESRQLLHPHAGAATTLQHPTGASAKVH